jgi:hypothetical protein
MANRILKNRKLPDSDYLKNLKNILGIEIPNELLSLFSRSNGGSLKFKNYICPNGERCRFHEFLFVGSDKKPGSFEETIIDLITEMKIMPNYLIPFGIDEGGDFYCMSIHKNFYGKIYFFWTEFYDNPKRAIQYIAPSLDEFINKMI